MSRSDDAIQATPPHDPPVPSIHRQYHASGLRLLLFSLIWGAALVALVVFLFATRLL